MSFILGRKMGMTRVYNDEGTTVPVTLVMAEDEIKCQLGDRVKVTGISKGRGFAGVVKRHGFSGSPKTHGHKHDLRAPGSIGCAYPEHVMKGLRMAGRLGAKKSSVFSEVVIINPEQKLVGLKGGVAGARNSQVKIEVLK